jgi:hypothetical protein
MDSLMFSQARDSISDIATKVLPNRFKLSGSVGVEKENVVGVITTIGVGVHDSMGSLNNRNAARTFSVPSIEIWIKCITPLEHVTFIDNHAYVFVLPRDSRKLRESIRNFISIEWADASNLNPTTVRAQAFI